MLAFLTVALASTAMSIPTDLIANSVEMVSFINNLQTTWKAGHNSYFRNMPSSAVRRLMGAKKMNTVQLPVITRQHLPDVPIPASFDARVQWPNCPTIGDIRDQSNCGSCWAIAAAEAISDRICIASKGKVTARISAADLMGCCLVRQGCTGQNDGCTGGDPEAAWDYWVNTGLCTGGNYTQKDGCKPYPFAPCEHHINGSLPSCTAQPEYKTPKCEKACQASYTKSYASDLHYGSRAYQVDNDEEAIQKEILTNGPVEAAFTVYEDFETYKSGVYQHKVGPYLGGHAVRILGWGVDNSSGSDVPYWLVANSWNADWGEKGYFKILRGKNHCGIEDYIMAGVPKTE